MRDEIPNFNGATVWEVWEWIGNFIPHSTGHVITYSCWDKVKLRCLWQDSLKTYLPYTPDRLSEHRRGGIIGKSITETHKDLLIRMNNQLERIALTELYGLITQLLSNSFMKFIDAPMAVKSSWSTSIRHRVNAQEYLLSVPNINPATLFKSLCFYLTMYMVSYFQKLLLNWDHMKDKYDGNIGLFQPSNVKFIYKIDRCTFCYPLRWRHNGRGCVSNHQPHNCLLNRLFGRRSK